MLSYSWEGLASYVWLSLPHGKLSSVFPVLNRQYVPCTCTVVCVTLVSTVRIQFFNLLYDDLFLHTTLILSLHRVLYVVALVLDQYVLNKVTK